MKRLDKQNLKNIIQAELEIYKIEFEKKYYDLTFGQLERVHIISQRFP
ncbi:MAG: DUF3703 domain-containing protein [Arcicella sp.]|nr:DUF3703 domain-containing protein [Arcicella sp.]